MNNINLITSERAGWIIAYNMLYVMFKHGVTYVRVGVCGQREDNEQLT